jgi:hypothetical protein
MNEGSESSDMDLEWENRVLCSDESCIGTIGTDGRCRECGRPHEGILPGRIATGPLPEAPADADGQADASAESQAPDPCENSGKDAIEEDSASNSDDEWERRTLCPDESCIGVIGPDGRCKECGRQL